MLASRILSNGARAGNSIWRVFHRASPLRRNLNLSRSVRATKHKQPPPDSPDIGYRDVYIVGGIFAAGLLYV